MTKRKDCCDGASSCKPVRVGYSGLEYFVYVPEIRMYWYTLSVHISVHILPTPCPYAFSRNDICVSLQEIDSEEEQRLQEEEEREAQSLQQAVKLVYFYILYIRAFSESHCSHVITSDGSFCNDLYTHGCEFVTPYSTKGKQVHGRCYKCEVWQPLVVLHTEASNWSRRCQVWRAFGVNVFVVKPAGKLLLAQLMMSTGRLKATTAWLTAVWSVSPSNQPLWYTENWRLTRSERAIDVVKWLHV